MIIVSSLYLQRGGRTVLHDFSMRADTGTISALVAPNGSGKSSLLLAMVGELPLNSGAIEFSRDHQIALVPQNQEFTAPFTVREVIDFARRKGATDESIAGAIEVTALEHLLDRKVTELSGGEAARTSLALGLAQSSTHILLDEPLASLDTSMRERVISELQRRAESGVTILIVVHALERDLTWCDQVIHYRA